MCGCWSVRQLPNIPHLGLHLVCLVWHSSCRSGNFWCLSIHHSICDLYEVHGGTPCSFSVCVWRRLFCVHACGPIGICCGPIGLTMSATGRHTASAHTQPNNFFVALACHMCASALVLHAPRFGTPPLFAGSAPTPDRFTAVQLRALRGTVSAQDGLCCGTAVCGGCVVPRLPSAVHTPTQPQMLAHVHGTSFP